MELAKDIMSKNVITGKKEESSAKIISKMEKYNTKEIPIVDNKKLVGMVTFFDILDMIKYPESKASNVMFMPPTVTPNTPIDEIIPLMVKTGLEAIPVVENESLVGIISDYDILNKYRNSKLISGLKVKNLVRKTNFYIEPEDNIAKARRIMINEKIDRLPVLKNGKIIGMVISIDILRAINKPIKKVRKGNRVGKQIKVLNFLISNVMRKDIPLLKDEMSIKDALKKLLLNELKGTVVISKDGKLEGLLYRFDILKEIAKKITKEGIWITFPSSEIHPDMLAIVKEKIARKARKMKAFMPNLNEIRVHIKQIHGKTNDHIYEISMRFLGPGLNKNVEITGYNIIYAIEEGLNKIERQLDKKKSFLKRVLH